MLVLSAMFALLALVVWLDVLTPWTVLLFYLVPQIAVSSMVRGYWWLVFALVATVAWYVVRRQFPGSDAFVHGVQEPVFSSTYNGLVRLGVLLIIGFLCARLRQYSRSPGTLSSSHDATGLLSMGGLSEALRRPANAERMARGPVAVLVLNAERRVSAFAGQSNEYAALVGAMISKVILDHARAADLCARLSPSQFLVVMPGTDRSAAAAFYGALQEALPEVVRSLDDSVTVSTLMLFSAGPVDDVSAMRAYGETRLTTLKVLGAGQSGFETWPPTPAGKADTLPTSGPVLTTG
jgi:GGDEF domain-containing protein